MTNIIIMSEDDKKYFQKLAEDFESDLVWGTTKLKDSLKDCPVDNRKWALIEVNGKSLTVPVDKTTMKAYETDGYTWTDREIPEYTFVRWARPMDL